MQIGCGFRVKQVRHRDYVYFWHYEIRGGRSRQLYEYMGPRISARTARRLHDAIERYFAKAGESLRGEYARQRHAVAALVPRPRRG
jgi:hypothetical protein